MIKTLNFLDVKNDNFINFLNNSIIKFELLNNDCTIDTYNYVIRSNKNKIILTAKFFNQFVIIKIKSEDNADRKAIYSMCDMANTYFVSKERIERNGALSCHSIVFKEMLRSFFYEDPELTFISIQYSESLDEAVKEFNKQTVVYNGLSYIDRCSRIKTEVKDVHLISFNEGDNFSKRELFNFIKHEGLDINNYEFDYSEDSFERNTVRNEERYTANIEFCMLPTNMKDNAYVLQNVMDEAFLLNEVQGYKNMVTGDLIIVTSEYRFFFHGFKNKKEFKFELIK